jgi:hypothetical protein
MTFDSHDRRLHSYYMCDVPTKSSNSKATPLIRHSESAFSKHPQKMKVFVFLSGFVCILFRYYNHLRGKSSELGL